VPLRLRLALLFAAGTALLVTVIGAGFLLQLTRSLDASLDTGLRTRADLLASRVATPTGADPFGTVSGSEQVAQVLTPDGVLLGSSEAAGRNSVLDAQQRRTALSGEVSFTGEVNGDRSRVLAVPFDSAGRRLLAVVGTGTDISDTAEDRVHNAILLGGPPAVLAAGLAAWVLAGAALRPVERMRRQVADITDQDRDVQLAVPGTRDEIARLAVTVNGLLTRLQHALERERSSPTPATSCGPRWRSCGPSSSWPPAPGAAESSWPQRWSAPCRRPTGWPDWPKTCCCSPVPTRASSSCGAGRSTSMTCCRRPYG